MFLSAAWIIPALLPLLLLRCGNPVAPPPPANDADFDELDGAKRLWRFAGADGPCAFSPDGKRVLLVAANSVVVVDAATGKPIGQRMEHGKGDYVYTAAFSPDGTRIVTASSDHTARIWDAASGKELARLPHKKWVGSALFSLDGAHVLTTGGGRSARLWNAATGKLSLKIPYDREVWRATFSPDGKRVLTISNGASEAAVWDSATGRRLLGPLDLQSQCGVFSPDGTRLALGDGRNLCIIDASSGKQIARSEEHWSSVNSVAYSPDGTKIVTSTDGYIRVWDATTAKPLTKPLGDRVSMMHAASFSPDGKWVVGAGEGAQTAVWDVATGKRVARAGDHDADVYAAFSPDGKTVVTAGVNASLVGDGQPSTSLWRIDAADGK